MIRKFNEMIRSTPSSKFKLGIDYHGVIDDMPEFFEFISDSIISNGGEVHIITGGRWEKVKKQMVESNINIKYTHHFSIIDYHRSIGTPTDGGVHPRWGFKMIDDIIWDKTKAEYCKRNNITLHIDDTKEYEKYFTTPFARLWTK